MRIFLIAALAVCATVVIGFVLYLLLVAFNSIVYAIYYRILQKRYQYMSGHLHGQAYYEFNQAVEKAIHKDGMPDYDYNLITLFKLSCVLKIWRDI